MQDIKIKPQKLIKKIDKSIVGVQKFKENIVSTKEKLNNQTINDNSNSGEEYAGRKLQNNINYTVIKGIEKTNELGNKSLKETQNNYIKIKQKIDNFKIRIKDKRADNIKAVNSNSKKYIKLAKNSTKLTKKNIKTVENVGKKIKKNTKQSVKASQKAIRITKNVAKKTIQAVKTTIKATIIAIKTIIGVTKAIISVIIAGGWVALIVIIIIILIGGFIAYLYNNGDENIDSSLISNNEIVIVARSQIGNAGGQPYWSWYGFDSRVEWCACFVSWCANECGLIDKDIIPKFSVCSDGINWFKSKNRWKDRNENYFAFSGDIIFFDWYDNNGNQDGISDHVGIVTKIDINNEIIYTIEGNTDDKCAERSYSFHDKQIMGYGTTKF